MLTWLADRLYRLEPALLRRFPNYAFSFRFRRYHPIQHDHAFLELFAQLQRKHLLIQSLSDAHNLWCLCAKTAKIPGDIAELGVYRGGTARLLGLLKQTRPLHLFDSFDLFGGMPPVRQDIDKHQQGDFAEARLDDVKALMADIPGVHFHPGFFPETAKDLSAATFSFVHLDADIYQSTLDGLKFFYPRLARGGMVVAHDYRFQQCPGVKKAFDEFFADKPEPVIELWDTQCLMIKQ